MYNSLVKNLLLCLKKKRYIIYLFHIVLSIQLTHCVADVEKEKVLMDQMNQMDSWWSDEDKNKQEKKPSQLPVKTLTFEEFKVLDDDVSFVHFFFLKIKQSTKLSLKTFLYGHFSSWVHFINIHWEIN